jgi:hypothetical protein
MMQLPGVFPAAIQKSRKLGINLTTLFNGVGTDQVKTVSKRLFIGRNATEGIGFMHDFRAEYFVAHGLGLSIKLSQRSL